MKKVHPRLYRKRLSSWTNISMVNGLRLKCLCFFVGTDFQKSVWYKLLDIPYGSTVSYGELAKQLDMPKAVRAVAAANGANAISIFAPCHRVIGSNHTLVGYGGGLPAKKRLLDLEINGKPLL